MINRVWKKSVLVLFITSLISYTSIYAAADTSKDVLWEEIATGTAHNLGIKQDGTVWIWGEGASELFGRSDDIVAQTIPIQVTGLTDITQVAAGNSHSLALKADGTVWAWGDNSNGEIGDGTESIYDNLARTYITDESRPYPVQVHGLQDIVLVAANFSSSYAVGEDGSVWAWGSFYDTVPMKLPGYSNVSSISTGYAHNVILKKDGTVWQQASSLLAVRSGNVQNIGSNSLVQLEGLEDIVAVAAGGGTSHALRADGTVWAWGYNSAGEIGDGTTDDRAEPVQLPGLDNVIAIAASAGGPMYLKQDGTVWSNGDNIGGQLGIGSYEDRSVPTQIIGLKKIKKIASSGIGFRAMAIRHDNTLWSWGNGSVGDGTKWWRTSPVWIRSYGSEILLDQLITVEIDGTTVDFDQQPVVINERTMVPLRMIFEALGADMTWDPKTQSIHATKGDRTISLTIGVNSAIVNGQAKPLDAPPVIINERTLVPARFIGEALGADVGWDEINQTVLIVSE